MAPPILPMPAMPIFISWSLPWRAAWLALGAILLGCSIGCSSAMSPLHEAAFTGNTPVVKEWVARKRGLDQTWDEPNRGLEGNYARLTGLTPLMMAARGGQLEAARLLVEGGANLYAQANTQLPGEPLTERMAVVSWLIDHGAAVTDRSFTWTPLIGAAVTQPPEMAALLLQRGADPNLRNDAGLTPIGAAADKCIRGINPPDSAPPALEAQLAVVELLAKASDPAVYASPEARSKLGILNNCCARRPQAGAQRRICEAFGI